MFRYQVSLKGPEVGQGRISAFALRHLLAVLTEGATRALRLRVEGRGAAQGPIPAWLRRATAFDVTGIQSGSAVLAIEAPSLALAEPGRFAQAELFPPFDSSKSCIDLFLEGLGDALVGNKDSELYDDDVIASYSRLEEVLGEGVDIIDFVGERKVEVRREGVQQILNLRRQTPAPSRVRVAGKLDLIRHSDRVFSLVLADGSTLRGVAGEVPPDRLSTFWGRSAVVSGSAVFRPSGRVLRIEADRIDEASRNVAVWSREPRPIEAGLDARTLRKAQGPRTGLSAMMGQWPGDETDEEVEAFLGALS